MATEAILLPMKTTTLLYINNTGLNIVDFHSVIMEAIGNDGVFGEDFADLFKLSKPAGVWVLEMV